MTEQKETCIGTTKTGARCRSVTSLVNGLCPSHDAVRAAEFEVSALRRTREDLKVQVFRLERDVERLAETLARPPEITPVQLVTKAIDSAKAGDFSAAQVWCALSSELRQVIRATKEAE